MSHSRPTSSHTPLSRRGWTGAVLLGGALLLAAHTHALAAIRTYSSLALKDGRLLSDVRVINYSTTDVLVRHLGGATSLRSDVLPDEVLAELHLRAPTATVVPVNDPAFLALADKVAVAPASTAPVAPSVVINAPAKIARASVPAEAAPAAESVVEETPAAPEFAPAGEGTIMLESTQRVRVPSPALKPTRVKFAGRVAVALPTGETHLLGDVEVRAYPAELLARYLAQAKAKSAELAEQLRTQAAAAALEGRNEESAQLNIRAQTVAAQYLNFLPTTPHTTRSDTHGHFTLIHNLRDMRIVAVGRINVDRGEWNYAWIGVAPGEDALLTEANATVVSAPGTPGTRFAAR